MRMEWGVEFPPGVEPRPFRTEAAARSYARAVEGKDFVRRDGSMFTAKGIKVYRRTISDWEEAPDEGSKPG